MFFVSMEINLKDNIYYKPYDNKICLNEDIVNFILSNKIDKVLYKGEPNDINYKLLKKIIPLSDKNTEPDIVRKKYKNVLEICDNSPFCIIYKK
jgi:hypothetical protein